MTNAGDRPASSRDEDGSHALLAEVWSRPPGLTGWLRGVNHRTIGIRYIVTAFVFFVVGGIQALILRLQLVRPENDLLGLQAYNELFTMHGTTMMFLFVVPMIEGLAVYLLPLMIGARDFPFPRLNSFGYYSFFIGGVFIYASFLVGAVPDGGWFAYPPLTSRAFSPDINMDFWLLGVTFVELSAISAAIEIIVGLLKFRAPGMKLHRMPVFAWSMLAVAFMIVLAFPALILASVMLEFDRAFGTHFYNPRAGGDAVLWQHLFWFFGHPEVYIQFLPAAGIISMVIPVFSRRPIVGYLLVVLSTLAIAFLSFGLWAHHMYTTGAVAMLAAALIAAASSMISIPNGVQVFAWIATVWSGRPVLRAPMLFALGFIVLFVIGGVTGVMLAIPAFNRQVHDTFFVVAHFHYVLIGGVVFPFLAGFHYWFPKMTGRMLGERLGIYTFWTTFIGFNVTFLPMHVVGLLGMPRRIGIYDAGLGWDGYNLTSTVGAFVLAGGILLFIVNVARSLLRGRDAPNDPWHGNSLEWSTTSPPPPYNFAVIPTVSHRDPLWEDAQRTFETPDRDSLAAQLVEPYNRRRETLVTSAVDANVEYAVVVPGPSTSPLLLAVAAVLVFAGFLTSYWITLLGIVLTAGVVLGWTWPTEPEGAHERERPPARHEGARSTAWWGMVMLMVFSTAVLAPLAFAHLQIWSVNESWPPPSIDAPGLLVPAVLTGVLAASVVAIWLGNRGDVDGGDRHLRLGFAAGITLAATFLVVQGIELARLDFAPWDHAYASLFFFVTGFHYVVVVLAVGVAAWALARSYLGHHALGHRNSADVAAMFWYYAAFVWLVVLLLVYLLPQSGSAPPEFRL